MSVDSELEEKGGVCGLFSIYILQRKNRAKRYWEMGKWNNLSAKEQQQFFDDQNNWNLGRNKRNDNGNEAPTNQTEMNHKIKQLQAQ